MSWYGLYRWGVGLAAGTGLRSLLKPSPDLYGRDVDDALMSIGITALVSNMLCVGLMVSP